jgi:hypothetical protein
LTLRQRTGGHPRLHIRTIGPVKLDLDDLNDLLELLRDRTEGVVSLRSGKYDADEVGDLVDVSDEDLANIVITTAQPAIQVTLTPGAGTVWSQTDDPAVVRLIDDVAEQANQHPLPLAIVYPWFIIVLLSVLLALLVYVGFAALRQGFEGLGAAIVIGAVLATAAYVWSLPGSWRYRGAVQVVPMRRHERRLSSAAFKRTIATAIVATVVGAILGGVAAWLAKGP